MLTFVLLGVGSGSTGISSALQNAFSFGSKGGTSISKLQKKVDQHPHDAASWRALATALEQKQRTQDAVDALERYTALKPHDQDALAELGSQYTTLAATYRSAAQAAQATAQGAVPETAFSTPPASSPFNRAFNDPSALQDPIAVAVQRAANARASDALGTLNAVASKAENAYRRLAKLNPTDATIQIQVGQAAQSANDTATAIAAYKKFLKLAPTDPLAPQVRSVLKQLAPPATKHS